MDTPIALSIYYIIITNLSYFINTFKPYKNGIGSPTFNAYTLAKIMKKSVYLFWNWSFFNCAEETRREINWIFLFNAPNCYLDKEGRKEWKVGGEKGRKKGIKELLLLCSIASNCFFCQFKGWVLGYLVIKSVGRKLVDVKNLKSLKTLAP